MTDERHDDEVLGRALSRAIETQAPNETPFERSRIADRPARRGFTFWQFAGVAAALVLALAFGSWFTRPTDTGPVATSPSPTTPSTATQAPVSTTDPGTPVRVFFVRDMLPPVSANALAHGLAPTTSEQRVMQRIGAAHDAGAGTVPAGAANPLALVGRVQTPTGGSFSYGVGVSITGDTANIEFNLPNGWQIHGAAQVQALIQQVVYLATEEPGIRKARITEQGKTNAVIDGLVVDKPLSREDVTDYDHLGSTELVLGHGDASAAASRKLTAHAVVEQMVTPDGTMARFEIDTDLQNVSPTVSYPDFKVQVFANDETAKPLGGKWRMVVTVDGTDTLTGTQTFDRIPLRGIVTTKQGNNTVYEIGLDDLRPWRTAIAYNPFRIIIDIGGDPRTIFADSNAVYAPAYGAAVGRTFQVSGIAHNFEAHVDIRVLDDKQKEIYRGNTTATNCCDPGGTFDATVTLPANVSGNIFLEVFEASARDGSDTKVIRIPLTVR